MPAFDQNLLLAMNGWAADHHVVGPLARFAAGPLIWLMGAAALGLALVAIYWRRVRAVASVAAVLRGGAAAAAALAGNWLFGRLVWFRMRPYDALPDIRLLTEAPYGWPSFPSGHSAAAFALAWSLRSADKAAGDAFLALAALVALGRVLAGVHYPVDVIAGAAAGWLWAQGAAWVAGRIGLERRLAGWLRIE